MRYTRLWLGLGGVLVASFAVLGYFGREIYRQAPPIPERVVTDRRRGALHRRRHPRRPERLAVDGRPGGRQRLGPRRLRRPGLVGRLAAPRGDLAARPLGRARARPALRRAGRRGAGRPCRRGCSGSCGPTPTTRRPATWSSRRVRAEAIAAVGGALRRRCSATTRRWPSCATPTRSRPTSIKTPSGSAQLNAFFFWAAWACADRAARATTVTYTNNWPPEPLIGNRPTGAGRRLVGGQLRAAAGGHRRAGLVLRGAASTGEDDAPRAARGRPAAGARSRRPRCGRR